ncbi:hypothetical protein ACFX13_040913 [Malus domestica]
MQTKKRPEMTETLASPFFSSIEDRVELLPESNKVVDGNYGGYIRWWEGPSTIANYLQTPQEMVKRNNTVERANSAQLHSNYGGHDTGKQKRQLSVQLRSMNAKEPNPEEVLSPILVDEKSLDKKPPDNGKFDKKN